MNLRLRYSWYRTLSIVWIFIFAMQWVDFTVPYLFEETTSLLTATLLTVACFEIVLPIKSFWSWILKLIIVCIVCRIVLINFSVYTPYGPFFSDQITSMSHSFVPYIWFSLGAWLLFECSVRLIMKRMTILLFISMNLIAFTILDSFTSHYLWSHVAWMVFAGLALLACHHLHQYQLKYPQGWKTLRRKPLRITLNVIIIFSCMMFAGINMPSVSPLLTDPYSMWKDWKEKGQATAVASSIETVSIDPASQNVQSGYSRDDKELGAGFDFSYSPVMNISTPVKSYWRGETRRVYTGKGWGDYSDEPRDTIRYEGAPDGEPLTLDQPGKIEFRQVEQIVTMTTERVYPVLFGAYSIESVELLDEHQGEHEMRWASREGELRWSYYRDDLEDKARPESSQVAEEAEDSGTVYYPFRYKVTANIPIIPLDKIRAAKEEELYDEGRNGLYLDLPRSVPDRVRRLAEEVTAEASTPYSKMELLRNYLAESYEYTNKPDLTLKQSDDFVDSFLFEIKQGYCDYFSTSMVVMARSLGVPARWVKGYAPGRLPDAEILYRFSGNIGGEYRVSNADAHSWAELYFGEEYGWIPFEATPGFESPVLFSTGDSEEVFSQTSIDELEAKERGGLFFLPDTKVMSRIYGSIAILGILYLIYRYRFGLAIGFMRIRLGRPLTPGEKIVFNTMHTVRSLRRNGFKRSQDETLRESFARWKDENKNFGHAAPLADSLLLRFEKSSYSPEAVTVADWRTARQESHQLIKLVRKSRKSK